MLFAFLTLKCSVWLVVHSLIFFQHGISGGCWEITNTNNTKPQMECRRPTLVRGTSIFREVLTQVMERLGEKTTSPEHGTLRESINTLETNSKIESEQPPPTPDISPIIRPEVQSIEMYLPCFRLSETKCSIVINKTQVIILELLMNSIKIYLTEEEVSQTKKNL